MAGSLKTRNIITPGRIFLLRRAAPREDNLHLATGRESGTQQDAHLARLGPEGEWEMTRRRTLVGIVLFALFGLVAPRATWACEACFSSGAPLPGHVLPGKITTGPELLRPIAGPSAVAGAGATGHAYCGCAACTQGAGASLRLTNGFGGRGSGSSGTVALAGGMRTLGLRNGPSGTGAGIAGPGAAGGGVNFLNQHIVVANRGSANISVIDVATNAVTNIPMPPGAATPDPMYFWYNRNNDLLYVGDRANDRVVVFNPRTYTVVNDNIPAGDGVFHMWGSHTTNRLWVVNDTAKAISVIDMTTNTNIGSRPTPADVGANAFPHDIVVEPDGSAAYVGIFSTDNPTQDIVVKYGNGAGFPEVDRGATGKSPHVGLTPDNNVLYAPSQNSDRADVLSRATMDPAAAPIPFDNAHGISPSEDGNTMYMTTFPGNGIDGLHVIDPVTNTLINSVDAPTGPHNVITSTDDTRLYITHSGATSTLVSIFDISGANRTNPVLLTTVNTGLNPFASFSVPAIPEPSGALLSLGLAGAGLLRRARHDD
jgi:DNA-binding beta-propeller fold protein YncE